MPIFSYFRYFWPDPNNTCMLIFSMFSYFIFLFLNFLSLFVFIFCETARTRRFSVIFAKVQWHPCILSYSIPFYSRQCPSTARMSPSPESNFLCPLLSLSIPFPVAPQCHLSSDARLVGSVVKASASRAEDPGFESRLRRDFSGVESYQ